MLFDNLPVDAVRPLIAWYEQKKNSPSDFKVLASAGGDGGSGMRIDFEWLADLS